MKSLEDPRILKKKSDFVSKCRYYNKYFIKNVTKMIAWIDTVFCMFMNYIRNFLFCLKKLENCIPEDFLTV